MPLRLPQLARIFHQPGPERRLPLLRFAQSVDGLALLPAVEPFRAVDQILVIKIGDARGELKQLALIVVVVEIVLQRAKRLFAQQVRQQRHQLPTHAGFIKGAFFGNAGQHAHEHIPNKGGGQRKGDIGGDAELLRQLHLQPLRHARALHQHHFRLERIA